DISMTKDKEDWKDYTKRGYHPVHTGDGFSDGWYITSLGYGQFSTVWFARDRHRVSGVP
ncbi:hypothetical protein M422DRAFT_160547, partial [Sphaerobolus stellatus SS14]